LKNYRLALHFPYTHLKFESIRPMLDPYEDLLATAGLAILGLLATAGVAIELRAYSSLEWRLTAGPITQISDVTTRFSYEMDVVATTDAQGQKCVRDELNLTRLLRLGLLGFEAESGRQLWCRRHLWRLDQAHVLGGNHLVLPLSCLCCLSIQWYQDDTPQLGVWNQMG
jgi:hypothetical protein